MKRLTCEPRTAPSQLGPPPHGIQLFPFSNPANRIFPNARRRSNPHSHRSSPRLSPLQPRSRRVTSQRDPKCSDAQPVQEPQQCVLLPPLALTELIESTQTPMRTITPPHRRLSKTSLPPLLLAPPPAFVIYSSRERERVGRLRDWRGG
mgnify:FL=1